jgi:hypothetical protein
MYERNCPKYLVKFSDGSVLKYAFNVKNPGFGGSQ